MALAIFNDFNPEMTMYICKGCITNLNKVCNYM